MFRPSQHIINAFIERLKSEYYDLFADGPPGHMDTIVVVARRALNRIARSDAIYHDLDHTLQVTLVGQDILRGRMVRDGDVDSIDWVNFVCSLLCFATGFSRDVCVGDTETECIINDAGDKVTMPRGATDAYLWPYFADRSKIFVRQRFKNHDVLSAERMAENIEYARFPPPTDRNLDTDTYPGLLRASHIIGAIADPSYMLKMTPLMIELEESGMANQLGYKTPLEFRNNYDKLFWTVLHPIVADGIALLKMTDQGREWLANMYAHVLMVEHDEVDL